MLREYRLLILILSVINTYIFFNPRLNQNKTNVSGKKKKKKKDDKDNEFICNPETTSAFQAYQAANHKKKNKIKGDDGANSKSNIPNPLQDIAASARKLGLHSLSKALDTVQYRFVELPKLQ
jgi:hypothetical protein